MVSKATIIALLMLTIANDAGACTNPPGWRIEDDIEHAAAIFVGEVERIEITRDWYRYTKGKPSGRGGIVLPEHGLMYSPTTTFTFSVDKAWKGVERETVTVSTGFSSCSADLRIARRYLVYAHKDENGDLVTGSLSTRPLSDKLEDLQLLGPPVTDFLLEKARAIEHELATKSVYREER
jgi:hypothetical protein